MKLWCFAVLDKKLGAYLQPFFSQSRPMAMRAFGDVVCDGESPFAKHAEDYSLWEIGSIELETAVFHSKIEALGEAVSFLVKGGGS